MTYSKFLMAPVVALFLMVGAFWVAPRSAAAETSVSISFFYNRLSPYGHWVDHPRYGHAWYPTSVGLGWRPYTAGRWLFTADFGWYWESDFDWGWAPFHYGRWTYDVDYGWIWVPGYDWAPAWVAWRSGGGHLGWAPLPPSVTWSVSIGLDFGTFDFAAVAYQPAWVFVRERYFLAPRLRPVIFSPARNITIIHDTVDITNYKTVKNRIVNRGVNVRRVERVTRRKVTRMKIEDVDRPGALRFSAGPDQRQTLRVFRPRVEPAPRAAPPAIGDTERQWTARRQYMEERQQAERAALKSQHAADMSRASRRRAAEIRARQTQERDALERQHARESERQKANSRRARPDSGARPKDQWKGRKGKSSTQKRN